MSERGEGFTARWSRRKQEVDQEDERGAVEIAALTPAAGDAAESEQPIPPPDLPPVESLTSESDFSQFMQEGVPEEVRRLALRKLWRLTPIIPDGLDDYDEDYSMLGMVVEKVSTLFKPGEGMRDPEPEEAESEETTDAEKGEAITADETETEENKTAANDIEGAPDDDAGGAGIVDDEVDEEIDDADGGIA